jgi:hypothetical protein
MVESLGVLFQNLLAAGENCGKIKNVLLLVNGGSAAGRTIMAIDPKFLGLNSVDAGTGG